MRTGPCLLDLVCLICAEHCRHHRVRLPVTSWYAKADPTFRDAMATVRRLFWT
ncbi:MAG: hypothetical protein HZA50_19705 [Planctomycetes bacterium]|nr:hypothetical protein [Planctomycetota bacterium]